MKKLLSVLFAATLILAACGGSGDDSADATFTFPLSTPTSMDMADVTDSYSLEIITNVVELLFEYDGSELSPAAAESYEVSDDGLVYTIKLKEGGKWFDSKGEELRAVTADDFVYGWQRMVDPEIGASYSYIFDGIVKNATEIMSDGSELYGKVEELGIKALDENTLEVTLAKEAPYFLELLTFAAYGPQSKEAVDEFGDDYGIRPETMHYSGVYRTTEFEVDSLVVLTKNDGHRDADDTYLDEIRFQVMADASAIFNAYKNDEVDLAGVGTAAIREEVENGDLAKEVESYGKAQLFFMSINTEKGHTKNENVRKALVAGFDNQTYIDTVRNSNDLAPTGYVPTGLTVGAYDGLDYRDVVGEFTMYDPDNAPKYVEAAKKELGVDEIKVELLIFEAETNKLLAEYFQAQMKEIGITVDVNLQPSQAFWDNLEAGNYNIGYSGWTADYGDPDNWLTTFFHSSLIDNTNYSRTNDPAIDKALVEASKITNPEERFKAYGEVEKQMVESARMIQVLQTNVERLVKPQFDVPSHPFLKVPFRYVTEKK